MRMRQNWLVYVLLVVVIGLLAIEVIPALKRPTTVSAQSGFDWKVMIIPVNEDGRKRLEADLNNPPAGSAWGSATLYMSGYSGGNAIAILKKR
jgi:hypothetical protein